VKRSAATVERLAPDAASVIAARRLARPAPWSQTGRDEHVLWGLCKGTRAQPYEVTVDERAPAYHCSCPSWKVPCKHALALMLLDAAGAVQTGTRPEWATLTERRAKREGPPADPEAAARRAAAREERVTAGVEDLRLWLRDAIRGGLGSARLRTWDEWDAFAARMVDAQAPGAASRLRSLGSVAAGRPDGWPERLLSGMALLHLLCEAYGRADGPLRADIRSLLGWNVGREEVLEGPRVQDRWTVLARVLFEQERLRVQRTWLLGERTGRFALLLDFAPAGGVLEPRPAPGVALDASLAFFPSATPLRALMADSGASFEAAGAFGSGGVGDALAATAEAVALNPWLDEWPVALESAVADLDSVSAADGSLPLGGPELSRRRLLAVSAGRPVSVFGLWNGERLRPLAAGDGERTVAL
jgi:hypothetical protein